MKQWSLNYLSLNDKSCISIQHVIPYDYIPPLWLNISNVAALFEERINFNEKRTLLQRATLRLGDIKSPRDYKLCSYCSPPARTKHALGPVAHSLTCCTATAASHITHTHTAEITNVIWERCGSLLQDRCLGNSADSRTRVGSAVLFSTTQLTVLGQLLIFLELIPARPDVQPTKWWMGNFF